jgi:ribosomal protein S18 acetylase RimI-like enzyme
VFEARSYGEPTVAAEIADPEHQTWVVEDAEGALVAYAHVGPSKLPHPDRRPGDGELYQLYLLPQVQGTGLGKKLLDLALDYLEAKGRPIWLGVWQGNLKAQHVYQGAALPLWANTSSAWATGTTTSSSCGAAKPPP